MKSPQKSLNMMPKHLPHVESIYCTDQDSKCREERTTHPPDLEENEGLVQEDGQIEGLSIRAHKDQIDHLLHHLHTAPAQRSDPHQLGYPTCGVLKSARASGPPNCLQECTSLGCCSGGHSSRCGPSIQMHRSFQTLVCAGLPWLKGSAAAVP